MAGLQGAGKTTTVGKLAKYLRENKKKKVLTVSADVYRPAAIGQLQTVTGQAGADFFPTQPTDKPVDIALAALDYAKRHIHDVLIIDTAGRLQNKSALMDELLKIVRGLKKIDPEAPHEPLLVLDATVGRNALAQEQIFGRTAYVSGLVMTKLDGTARGGVLVPVAQASDAPIKLIGVGEGIDDLQPFDARAFSRSLVGLED